MCRDLLIKTDAIEKHNIGSYCDVPIFFKNSTRDIDQNRTCVHLFESGDFTFQDFQARTKNVLGSDDVGLKEGAITELFVFYDGSKVFITRITYDVLDFASVYST